MNSNFISEYMDIITQMTIAQFKRKIDQVVLKLQSIQDQHNPQIQKLLQRKIQKCDRIFTDIADAFSDQRIAQRTAELCSMNFPIEVISQYILKIEQDENYRQISDRIYESVMNNDKGVLYDLPPEWIRLYECSVNKKHGGKTGRGQYFLAYVLSGVLQQNDMINSYGNSQYFKGDFHTDNNVYQIKSDSAGFKMDDNTVNDFENDIDAAMEKIQRTKYFRLLSDAVDFFRNENLIQNNVFRPFKNKDAFIDAFKDFCRKNQINKSSEDIKRIAMVLITTIQFIRVFRKFNNKLIFIKIIRNKDSSDLKFLKITQNNITDLINSYGWYGYKDGICGGTVVII